MAKKENATAETPVETANTPADAYQADVQGETVNEQGQQVLIISKLSMGTIKVNPGAVKVRTDGQPQPLARVYGVVTGLKAVEDKVNGTIHTALKGDFEAENLQNGVLFRSGILYLPKGIHETLQGKAEQEEEGTAIQFAFQINSVTAANPIGYSYQAMPLLKVEATDPLAKMRNALRGASQHQLAS